MKKIVEGGEVRLPPAKLYLEDLRELYEILARENASGLSVRAGGHALDSIEELDELQMKVGQARLHSFQVSSQQPRISLHHSLTSSTISYDAESTPARGIASRLEEKWKSRKKKVEVIAGIPTFMGMLLGAWMVGKSDSSFLLALVMAGFAAYVFAHLEIAFGRISTVLVLHRRNEHQGFWRRNVDKIWLLVLGGVAGTAFTLLGKYILNQLGIQ
jgi:hypothetical protein